MPHMYSVKGGSRTAFEMDGCVPHLSDRDAVYVVRLPAEGLPAFFIYSCIERAVLSGGGSLAFAMNL